MVYHLHVAGYRLWRRIRGTAAAIVEELTGAQKRTLVEVALTAPIALLAFKDVRDWASAWPYTVWVVITLIVGRVCFGVWKRSKIRAAVLDRVAEIQRRMLAIIECTSAVSPGKKAGIQQLTHLTQTTLRAIAEIAREGLGAPGGVSIHANLMFHQKVRIENERGRVPGLAIVAYDRPAAKGSWTRIVSGDIGAGRVIETMRAQVVEDTNDPKWMGAFDGSRVKSFASFPVLGRDNDVIAVLNIDATRPLILTEPIAEQLYQQVLSAPLMLLSQLIANVAPKADPLKAPAAEEITNAVDD